MATCRTTRRSGDARLGVQLTPGHRRRAARSPSRRESTGGVWRGRRRDRSLRRRQSKRTTRRFVARFDALWKPEPVEDRRTPTGEQHAPCRPEKTQDDSFGEPLSNQLSTAAPIAIRTATSRRRLSARASSRLATFAQAIARTRTTAAVRSTRTGRARVRTPDPSASGTAVAVMSRFVAENATASRRPIVSSAAALAASVASFFKRATRLSHRTSLAPSRRALPSRCRRAAEAGRTSSCIAIGTHASGTAPSSTPANSRGATPTTVYALPFSVIDRPTMSQ